MAHTYRLMLSKLANSEAENAQQHEFDFISQEDLENIFDQTKNNNIVTDDEIYQFCVGLKLFMSIAMKHRKDQHFDALWPHLRAFLLSIKANASREK